MIYQTHGEHANHYTTDDAIFKEDNKYMKCINILL